MNRKPRPEKVPFLKDIRANKELYTMLIPFFLLFFLMIMLPIVVACVLSLTYYNMFETPVFVGLQNYINLFVNDEVFAIAMRNTLLFSVITGPVSYLMCFGLAWLINEFKNGLRVFFTFCFYAPSLAGTSVYFIWQFLFSGDAHGFVNSVLMSIGIIQEPIQWLTDTTYNFGVLILVQLWMCLGTGFLAFIAGFKGIDRSLYRRCPPSAFPC